MEHLLHEEEGVELDFKRDQYKFVKADDESKSELLKDIIAFANAWRRSTAYILIGVEEIKGSRGKVVGVSSKLDDATLQQFVNSKTQRPVEFSYQSFYFEGVDVGIIEIPVQERPIYLNRDFGKLEKEKVYLRRGSSTDIATPDEIARMGSAKVTEGTANYVNLLLEWADIHDKGTFSSSCSVYSLNLEPQLPNDTFSPRRHYSYGLPLDFSDFHLNPHYSREIISFAANAKFFTSIGLRIYNDSGAVARRIRFVGSIMKSTGIEVRDWLASAPSRYLNIVLGSSFIDSIGRESKAPIYLQEYNDRWEVTVDFGDVRPHEKIYTTDVIFVGSRESEVARLEGQILGDNIPSPITCSLDIHFEVEHRPMEILDVTPYLSDE